jgi:hypothetical protein
MNGINNSFATGGYFGSGTTNNITSDTPPKGKNYLTGLRYAPIIGSALNVVSDSLGLTNKPDYSNADMLLNATSSIPNVSYTPIGNYLTYRPFDRNFYANKLQA